jgi:PKD repeat protein
MRRWIALPPLLAALALASCPQGTQAPPAPAKGKIAGLVKDIQKGTPVEGAIVQAGTASALTSPSGRFEIVVGPGSYSVRIRKDGYQEFISPSEIQVQPGATAAYDAVLSPVRDDPPSTHIQQTPPPLGRNREVAFVWSGTDDRTPPDGIRFSFRLDGLEREDRPFGAETSHTFRGLPDGKYVFRVRARDEVGNLEAKPQEFAFEVDGTPPLEPSILLAGGQKFAGARAVEIVCAAEGAAEAAVWEGAEPAAPAWTPFRERKQVVLTAGDGEKILSARYRDAAGNATDAVSCSVVLDQEPPKRPENLRAEVFEASEVRLAWDPSADAGSGVEQYLVLRDGLELGKSRTPTFADRQVQLGSRYTYAVTAEDRIGHKSDPSAPALAAIVGRPPLRPSSPDPAHEASSQPMHVTLTWQGGDPDRGDAVTYDLYFGTGAAPPLRASGLTSPSFAAMNLKPATAYSWRIIAKDRQGLTAEGDTWTFTTSEEPNTSPAAALSAAPASGPISTSFRFDASASNDKEDPTSALRFRWDFDGDGKPDTEWSEERTTEKKFGSLGPRTVYVLVQDSKGAVSKASARVEVVNSPPRQAGEPLPQNGSTQELPDVALSWRFSDPDPGDKVAYDVFLGTSEQTLQAVARRIAESSFKPAEPLRLGTTYYWRVDAYDTNEGALKGPLWSFATRKVAGKIPLFAEILVNVRTGKTTTPFRFDASGSRDPEEPPDTLKVRWDWNGDGTPDTEWTAEKQAVRTFPSVGENKVCLEVRNSKGETAKATVVLTVQNTAPVFVGTSSPRNGAAKLEPGVRFSWEANDPDPEDEISYNLFLGPPGPDLPLAAKGLKRNSWAPPAPLKPGTYNWKVSAADRNGAFVETPLWTFSVREEENLPPARPRLIEANNTGHAGTRESVRSSSVDPEGGPVRIRFDWGDGTMSPWVAAGPDGKAEAKHVWAHQGAYEIRAQASDLQEKASEWSLPRGIRIGAPATPGEGGNDIWFWDPKELNEFPNLYTLNLRYWFANLGGGGNWEGYGDPRADLDFRPDLGVSERGLAPWFRMQFGRYIATTVDWFQADYTGSKTLGSESLFGSRLFPSGTVLDAADRVRLGRFFFSFNPYMGDYFGGGADLGGVYFFNRTKLQPLGTKSVTETFETYLPYLGIHLYGVATKFFRVNLEFSYIQGGIQEFDLRFGRMLDVAGDLTFTPWHWIGLSLGYRYTRMYLKTDEGGIGRSELDLRLDGMTLALFMHF